MVIVYLVKGLLFKKIPAMKKAGIASLLMLSSFVLFAVTAPDTPDEEYLAEEDTAETENIEQAESEEDAQGKEEKEAKEKAEQKAREEEEWQQENEEAEKEAQAKEEERVAKEKAEEEAQKKEEERIAKEKAKQEERDKEEKERKAKEEAEQAAKEKEEKAAEQFSGYRLIKVDGGNLSGHREAKVVVDIGFGDREYWAFTNEHGQLVRVVADKIILQNDDTEPVKSSGRYFHDEAKVPGTESSNLDEGHVIADSLGGVANAYNITPQNSTMNRHGDQAYMERNISQAGGATNFEAIITYPDTKTQIPSKYKFSYTIRGNSVVDEFENVNPDEYNKEKGITESKPEPKEEPKKEEKPGPKEEATAQDVSTVDANGNGTVTIGEAEAAGYSMPIREGHWLYPYMIDRDGDGMVGE